MPIPFYVANAASNATVAIGLAATGWFFVSWQRSARLKVQLTDLLRVVRDDNVSPEKAIYTGIARRQLEWTAALEAIQADLEKIPDRLVRLNAKSQRALRAVFDGLDENLGKALAKILEGEHIGDPIVDRAVKNLEALRDSITIWSFVEMPWRRGR